MPPAAWNYKGHPLQTDLATWKLGQREGRRVSFKVWQWSFMLTNFIYIWLTDGHRTVAWFCQCPFQVPTEAYQIGKTFLTYNYSYAFMTSLLSMQENLQEDDFVRGKWTHGPPWPRGITSATVWLPLQKQGQCARCVLPHLWHGRTW